MPRLAADVTDSFMEELKKSLKGHPTRVSQRDAIISAVHAMWIPGYDVRLEEVGCHAHADNEAVQNQERE